MLGQGNHKNNTIASPNIPIIEIFVKKMLLE